MYNVDLFRISQIKERQKMIPWQPEQGLEAVLGMPESVFIIICIFIAASIGTYIIYLIFRLLFWIFRMDA
jgi:hypothetical protein